MRKTLTVIIAATTIILGGAACTTEDQRIADSTTDRTVGDWMRDQVDVPDMTTIPIEPPTTTTTVPPKPQPSDFSLSLFRTSYECFDTAGALWVVDVDVAYHGPAWDYDATLVYQIDGGEDGPIIDSVRLYPNGEWFGFASHVVGTSTCPGNLTVRPIELRLQGIA